jgi:mono/diheme cytochrome c family protein
MLRSQKILVTVLGMSALLATGCQSAPEDAGGTTTGGTTGTVTTTTSSPAAANTPAAAVAVAAPTVKAAPDAGFDAAKTQPGYAEVKKMGKNPHADDLKATQKGAELFATNCASCHGPSGQGDGPAGLSLNPKPRNQTNSKEYKYGYGDLGIFRTIKHGVTGTGMAPFGGTMSDEDIWAVTNFVRTLQKS